MRSGELFAALRAGAVELECPLSDAQAEALLAYLALLVKWNSVYNLTAVRDPTQMLTQHLLDCLSIVAPLRRYLGDRPARVLDVGSGAGLPGIVLAVMSPALTVTCVDAVAKKTVFMRQVAGELHLRNLDVRHARVETLAALPFDLITSRAFSSLAELVCLTRIHLSDAGAWLAMKGRYPADEIADLPAPATVFHVEQVHVPGLESERWLIWMRLDGAAQ
jgi:16S rRNA (guanine527-N7)-methyltransferase